MNIEIFPAKGNNLED